MKTVIQVQVRSVYGNALIYPANQAALLIANLASAPKLGFDSAPSLAPQ